MEHASFWLSEAISSRHTPLRISIIVPYQFPLTLFSHVRCRARRFSVQLFDFHVRLMTIMDGNDDREREPPRRTAYSTWRNVPGQAHSD